jgi:hypothetical protein
MESNPVLPLPITALKSTLYQIGMATLMFKGPACWDLMPILERQFWRSIAGEALHLLGLDANSGEVILEKHYQRCIAKCLSTRIRLSQTERDD